MSTLGQDRGSLLKERKKSLAIVNHEKAMRLKEESTQEPKEKLEYELARLENTIKLCEYDLKNPSLANNISIIRKLFIAKEQMIKVKENLNIL